MNDEPRDGPKRSLGEEIRDTVEQEIRDGVGRFRDRNARRAYRRAYRRTYWHSRGPSGIFFGLIIVALGVVFLLDQQGIVPAHVSFHFFWGAILLVWGLEIVLANRHAQSFFWGTLLIIVGSASLVAELGFIHIWIGSLWPLLIIAFGILILLQRMGVIPPGGPFCRSAWRGRFSPDYPNEPEPPGAPNAPSGGSWPAPPPSSPGAPNPTSQNFSTGYIPVSDVGSGYTDSRFSQVAILSGFKRRITSQQFRYANVSAVLGGFELDLRNADIDGQQAIVQLACVLGGGEIRIPDTWKVIVETDTVGGGFSDETHLRPADPTKQPKRLIVRGTLVFGGIVIKN